MLHTIDKSEINKHRCDVCGESAIFIDDNKKIHSQTGEEIQIGTGKGLVYATCDHCHKKICALPELRPIKPPIERGRLIKLSGHYKDSKCCMQEAIYLDHMNNPKIITCCRDNVCMQYFQEDLRQKRLKIVKFKGIRN